MYGRLKPTNTKHVRSITTFRAIFKVSLLSAFNHILHSISGFVYLPINPVILDQVVQAPDPFWLKALIRISYSVSLCMSLNKQL